MALDAIIQGTEDLYEVSKIYLFGKPFKSLRFVRDELAGSSFNSQGDNKRVDIPPSEVERTLIRDRFGPDADKKDGQGQCDDQPYDPIEQATQRNTPRLARIYSFTYEGQYYKLPYPLIYLVWGDGGQPDTDEGSGLPSFKTQNTGLEGKGWRFASDIRVWKMDKHESSMVIDLEVGELEDILLEPVCDTDEDGAVSSRARVASRARMSSRARMNSRARMMGGHQG
jgi:hypothetical protein